MKLQEASRKEVRRIAIGTAACDGIMILALYVLSLVGVGTFSLRPILTGAVLGSAVAVANFVILCLTVQAAVGIEDKKKMKAQFQLSYNLRLALQAVWVVVCYLLPYIHFVAGAVPILFPNVVIFFLQSRGKLVSPSTAPAPSMDAEDPEDHLNSFEV